MDSTYDGTEGTYDGTEGLSYHTRMTPFLLSFVATILSALASRWLTPLFFSTYRSAPHKVKREWDTRYACHIYAMTVVPFTLATLFDIFSSRDDESSVVSFADYRTRTIMATSLGYFLAEMFVCCVYEVGGVAMMVHHVTAIAVLSVAVLHDLGHVYILSVLITEITTPFVNMRWWLDKAGMKRTRLYLANGLAMTVLWSLFRVALFPVYFAFVLHTWRHICEVVPFPYRLLSIFPPLVLSYLNWSWFLLILRGARKAIITTHSTHSTHSAHSTN